MSESQDNLTQQIINHATELKDVYEQEDNKRHELETLSLRLQELDEMKNTFVELVYQELRAPVTIISDYLQVMAERLKDKLDPQDIELFDMISSRNRQLVTLVDDITNFAHLNRSDKLLQPGQEEEKQNLAWIVHNEVQKLETEIQSNEIKLRLDIPEQINPANIEPARFRVIVSHLLKNAVKFNRLGGWIQVNLKLENNIENVMVSQNLVLEVGNSGSTIPDEKTSRIFDSFWQLQEGQKQNPSGIGLGLSLVQRAVSSFKGQIRLDSSEEMGTFFTVILPYIEWQDPVKLNLKLQQVQSMNMKYAQDLRSLYDLERKKNAELDKLSRDLAEKQERLNLFLSRLLTTQEEERRSISRDLHDGLAQTLTFANQMTEIVELEVPQVGNSKAFTRARDGIKAARTEIRRLVAGLRPDALDRFGLIPALRDYFQALAREQGWKTSFEVQGDFGEPGHSILSTKVEENFFRIAQEALSNIARHAHTSRVALQLALEPNQVSLLVQDWGVGFKLKNGNNRIELDAEPNAGDNKPHTTGHFGLIGVEERIRLLGGTLDIKSEPGEGTTLCARVPL